MAVTVDAIQTYPLSAFNSSTSKQAERIAVNSAVFLKKSDAFGNVVYALYAWPHADLP